MNRRFVRLFLGAVILALLSASAFFPAAGGESGQMTYTEWKDRVLNLQRFTFKHHENGIGLGDCPVYTAPSRKALRFANNRQAVDTNKELYEAGKTEDGWLLVRYDPGNGKIRTGYIPPEKVSGFKSSFSLRGKFDAIPVIAADVTEVTDDPITGKNIFATLTGGESFTLLAKYTYQGNWWYIECTVDGKTARGFIDREASSFYPGNGVADNMDREPVNIDSIGAPSVSPAGEKQAGEIVINGKAGDTRKNVYKDANPNSDHLTVVYPARSYPYYATKTGSGGSIWYYVFVEEDTMWGWVAGESATPVQIPLSPATGGNGKWGYADRSGTFVIPPQYDHAFGFRGNYAEVVVYPEDYTGERDPYFSGFSGIIDRDGNCVLEPVYFMDAGYDQMFYGGRDTGIWLVCDSGDAAQGESGGSQTQCGFFDIPSGFFSGMKWTDVYPWCSDSSLIPVTDSTYRAGYADRTTGAQVIPCLYASDDPSVFNGGVAAVCPVPENHFNESYEEACILIDETGAEIPLPDGIHALRYEGAFDGRVLVINDEELYGFADAKGNVVIRPQFMDADRFHEGLAVVQFQEDDYGFIDPRGKVTRRGLSDKPDWGEEYESELEYGTEE